MTRLIAQHRTRLGIFCLTAGLMLFSVQDLILKLISGSYPLYQAMLIRGLTSAPLLLLFAHLDGGLRALITPGLRGMLWRGGVMCLAYFSYYLALAALPLPTTVALYFSGPLFITVLSVLFLAERVGWAGWVAVLAGFAGVIIMVQPGSALFDAAALLAVLSGLAYGVGMIFARQMGRTETAAALAFWGNAVFLTVALALALVFGGGDRMAADHVSLTFLTRGWVTPAPFDLLAMMACGVIAALGLWLLTQAYRVAAPSVVAPFEYSAMVWGVIWGWLIWGDWPDATGWLGIALIVGAGLLVALREGIMQKAAPEGGLS